MYVLVRCSRTLLMCVLVLVVCPFPGVGDSVEEDEVIAEIETDKVGCLLCMVYPIPSLSLTPLLPLSPSPLPLPLSH